MHLFEVNAHFLANIQSASDFAVNRFLVPVEGENWYANVFEGSESKNSIKNLFRYFFYQKLKLKVLGGGSQKMAEIESLSDFNEIWYTGVFEGADFENRIHFFIVIFWVVYSGF